MKVLVTGNAGFIGFHTAKRLLDRGDDVVGFDVVNDYYDPALKEARLRILDKAARNSSGKYEFHRHNLASKDAVDGVFKTHKFDRVIHLAAQAGVRYSLVNPQSYVDSNITGFLNIMEACRYHATPHLTYASSSSVYGGNTTIPFSEHHDCGHPLSMYAATKRANELMAHTYSHLFQLPTTGLRFFTVYGPWGRPDMAPFIFTKNILEGRPIQVFNHGQQTRDFTFVDDIVEGVIRSSDHVATPDPAWSSDSPDPAASKAPFRIFNIGNNAPVELTKFIAAIEHAVGKTATREMLPMQPGDVPNTFADVSELVKAIGYAPSTPIAEGVRQLVQWFADDYPHIGKS